MAEDKAGRTGPTSAPRGSAAEAPAERPVLLVFRRPPYGTVFAAEGLRMAEALLAFQIPMRAVFVEDGIFDLLKGQRNERLGFGDLGSAFSHLESMGLKELLVLQEDLSERRIRVEDLVQGPIRTIRVTELRSLIEEAKVVMPF